ncbi:hypothetical protein Ahu01nite_061050 [Winogradskya humida]|uniref:Uncharacterized protein n=1 Tax=Winogradskya humida TaxID=113566 RepID=A0ABQ3ZX42_9ACTN|nr:hypothetical protein Ahu01nite_061050 [Actinoplanes humidus]
MSAPNPEVRLVAGDPTVQDPPFPLTSFSFVLSAGVGTPRDFMAPDTCDELLLLAAGP